MKIVKLAQATKTATQAGPFLLKVLLPVKFLAADLLNNQSQNWTSTYVYSYSTSPFFDSSFCTPSAEAIFWVILSITSCNDCSLKTFFFFLMKCMICRHEDVNHYEQKAPHAKMAHPTPDHFYPLHVALGAAGERAKAELIHQSWEDGSLSYSSYRFKS